jgi:hypothetical protein
MIVELVIFENNLGKSEPVSFWKPEKSEGFLGRSRNKFYHVS